MKNGQLVLYWMLISCKYFVFQQGLALNPSLIQKIVFSLRYWVNFLSGKQKNIYLSWCYSCSFSGMPFSTTCLILLWSFWLLFQGFYLLSSVSFIFPVYFPLFPSLGLCIAAWCVFGPAKADSMPLAGWNYSSSKRVASVSVQFNLIYSVLSSLT